MRKVLGVAAVAALAAACAPSGMLSGTVAVKGGSPAGITVFAEGPASAVASVADDGTFTLEGLPDGVYLLEAVAPSTIEERISVSATVEGGRGAVPELSFTGAGRVSGRVTTPTGPNGAEVFVPGFALRQDVAADGTFVLPRVPAGAQTIAAVKDGYEPVYLPVDVPFGGEAPDQILALTEVAHGPGRIEGRAYFFDERLHAGIVVKVEGTQLSAQTDDEGRFTITGVPLGYVTLTAEAAGYQPARAVNVLSAQGGTLRAPDLRLDYAAPRFVGEVSSFSISRDKKSILFVGRPEFDSSYYLYLADLASSSAPVKLHRVGTVAATLTATWHPTAGRALVRLGSSTLLYAVDAATATLTLATAHLFSGEMEFSQHRAFFVERANSGYPSIAVFDFDAGAPFPIDEIIAMACPGAWSAGLFTVSADGRVAYRAITSAGAARIRIWNGTVQEVSGSGPVSCVNFRGGNHLLGIVLALGNMSLVRLDTGVSTLVPQTPTSFLGTELFAFTGDEQYAWFTQDDPGTGTTMLRTVPITGGTITTLATGAAVDSFPVQAQPGGSQLAYVEPAGNFAVRNADGSGLVSFPVSASGGRMLWSPGGKHLVRAYASDRRLRLTDAATHTEKILDQMLTLTVPVDFSPNDEILYYPVRTTSLNDQYRFYRTSSGSAVDLPFLASSMAAGVTWSPGGDYAAIRYPGGDYLLDAKAGTAKDLGQAANALNGTSPLFTGDGSRLLFAEDAGGTGRILSTPTQQVEVRQAADGDGAQHFGTVPGTSHLWMIGGSGTARPAGLYSLVLP